MFLAGRSRFARNVTTMLTGTALAQIIPVLASPILTRLYDPSDFALLGLFVALASILSVVIGGRYELAVMLPESDPAAVHVGLLAIFLAVTLSLLTCVVTLGFSDPIVAALGNPEMSRWLTLVPVMALFMVAATTLRTWENRNRGYRRLAGCMVAQQAATAGVAIASGAAQSPANGLVVGRVLGQMTFLGALTYKFALEHRALLRDLNWRTLLQVARTHCQFPQYNVGYSLLGTVSREYLVIMFTVFGYIQAAGFYGLLRGVMYAPASLLSSSLGQVFYKEANDTIGTERLQQLMRRLMRGLADGVTPLAVFLVIWAEDLFALVFGEQWREAGRYAAVLSPVVFLMLFTSWPERLYEITNRQNVSFKIQAGFDICNIVTIVLLLRADFPPLLCLAAYSLIASCYHLAYLLGLFSVARLDYRIVRDVLTRVLLLAAASTLVLLTIETLLADRGNRLVAGIAFLGIYYAYTYRTSLTGLLTTKK